MCCKALTRFSACLRRCAAKHGIAVSHEAVGRGASLRPAAAPPRSDASFLFRAARRRRSRRRAYGLPCALIGGGEEGVVFPGSDEPPEAARSVRPTAHPLVRLCRTARWFPQRRCAGGAAERTEPRQLLRGKVGRSPPSPYAGVERSEGPAKL